MIIDNLLARRNMTKYQLAKEAELPLQYFWDMFVVDALLGNFDRHNGNWGFLYDPVLKSTKRVRSCRRNTGMTRLAIEKMRRYF